MAQSGFIYLATVLTILNILSSCYAGYKGCYLEILQNRVFSLNPGGISPSQMTPVKCISACGGAKKQYAGLTGGTGQICFCSDTLLSLTKESDAMCTSLCPGDNAISCGSKTHLSIYDAHDPIKLKVSPVQKVVQAGVTAEVSYIVETMASEFAISADFDDGGGIGQYVVVSGDNKLNRTFHMANRYDVAVYATSADLSTEPVEVKTGIQVEAPVGAVTMNCPPNMATHEPDEITVDIARGTGLLATIAFTDGNPGAAVVYGPFSAADACDMILGNGVQTRLNKTDPALVSPITPGLIWDPVPAKRTGTLAGFEIFAVSTGSLNVQVYRPSCAPNVYCDLTNSCVPDGSCVADCTGNQYCADTKQCCAGGPSFLPFAGQHQLVHTIPHTVTQTGYEFVPLPAGLDVNAGDVITHDSPSVVAATSDTSVEQDYVCALATGATNPLDTTGCSATGLRHHIGLIYSDAVSVKVPMTFTGPGNVSITATIENRNPNIVGGPVVSQCNINVLEGVNASIFAFSRCLVANELETLTLEPFTGGTLTHWNFGDGNTADVSGTTGAVTHTYNAPGLYNVTANVTNPLSYKFNETTVCVQERITNLNFNIGLPIEANTLVSGTLSMTSGSDFNCTFTITSNDGSESVVQVTEAEIMPSGAFDYTYTIPGDVTISTTCYNAINSVTVLTSSRVVERITNARLSPPGATANVDFNILLLYDSGTDVTITLAYDSTAVSMTVDEAAKSAMSGPMTELTTGSHTVYFTISNSINSVTDTVPFVIEVEIQNDNISCSFVSTYPGLSTTAIPLNTGVDCYVDMSAGTSVNLTANWGDGNSFTDFVGSGVPWSSNSITFPINHVFNTPGLFTVVVTVHNNFNSKSRSYPVYVMVPVTFVELSPILPMMFHPPASTTVSFYVTSGPNPNFMDMYVGWGDGTSDLYENLDIANTIYKEFNVKQGVLTISWTARNIISEKSGSVDVTLMSPIVNNTLTSNPIAGVPNVALDLQFSSFRAPGPGQLDLEFDCDTSVPGTLGVQPRIESSPFGVDNASCTYLTVGNYTASVTATSLLESQTAFYDVEIMNPVTPDFNVFTSDPTGINYHASNSCPLTLRIEYFGSPLPDRATIDIDFGDGSPNQTFPFVSPLDVTYMYADHGHFYSTISIHNRASKEIRKVLTGCYKRFLSAGMTVRRQPALPLDSPSLPGFGVGQDQFSSTEDLKIEGTFTGGTFVWWDVAAVAGPLVFTCNSTDESVITFNIPEAGTYTLTIQPMNPLYAGPIQSTTIVVISPVENPIIMDMNGISNAFEFRNFNISMESYGQGQCVAVVSGELADNNVYLYGDSTTCALPNLPLEWAGRTQLYDSMVDTEQPFTLSYQYFVKGTKTLELFAWNPISTAYASLSFAVSNVNCFAPNIYIQDRQHLFKYQKEYIKSNRNKVTVFIDIQCPHTLSNEKSWSIVKVDSNTNEVIAEIPVSSIPSSKNAELSIPPKFLDYGTYKVMIKVTMLDTGESGEQFFSTDYTYIRITKSKLVVQAMAGGVTKKTVGPSSIFHLNPAENSYDPDLDIPHTLDFSMACIDTTLEEAIPDSSVTTMALNLTSLPQNHISQFGCFQMGPGWILNFNGSLTIETSVFTPGHIYEFLIVGYSDTRNSSFTFQIEVLLAEPPEFDVNYKIQGICSPGPSGRICNPNSQLGFVVDIKNMVAGYTYSCKWEMFANNYEFCGDLYDCWQNLTYLDAHIEGTSSSELTLHPTVFELYSQVNLFKIVTMVTNDQTGTTGTLTMLIERNTPPFGGTCNIDPVTGTALVTNFTISCTGFRDEHHEISNYNIMCEVKGINKSVASGSNAVWMDRMLPAGDKSNGNILKCFVFVKDELGSVGMYSIHDVVISEPSMADVRAMMADLQNRSDDVMDILAAEGNLATSAGFATAAASLLFSESKASENIDFAGIGSAASMKATPFGGTEARSSPFETTVNDPAAVEAYKESQNNIGGFFNQVVDTLKVCTSVSIEETVLLAKTLETVSQSPEYLTRHSQEGIMDMLLNSIGNIKDNMGTSSVEDVSEISHALISTCACIEEAAKLSVENPIKLDIDSQITKLPEFPTNIYSEVKDIPFSENGTELSPEDLINSALLNLNRHEQVKSAEDNLKRCERINDDIQSVITSIKTKSNIPTAFNSSLREVMIYNTEASQLINKSYNTNAGSVEVPADILSGLPVDSDVSMWLSAGASSGCPETNPTTEYSNTVQLAFKHKDGTPISVDNTDSPIVIEINQDRYRPLPPPAEEIEMEIPSETEIFYYQKLDIFSPRCALAIKFRPTNDTAENQLFGFLSYQEKPKIGSGNIEVVFMIPNDTSYAGVYMENGYDPYTYYLDADKIADRNGTWYLGIRQAFYSELDSMDTIPAVVPTDWPKYKTFYQNTTLTVSEYTCAYTKDGDTTFQFKGCKARKTSTNYTTVCECNHLTTFAGGWVVAPNTLDWNFIFSNADFLKNPTLYITEIVIIVCYIVAMIWARRADKQDLTKLGLAPLLDNDPRDKYYYEIMVETGLRRNAGTDSMVHFILSGEEDETDVRTFSDKKRKIFQRGNTDGFLMAVPSKLGSLSYLRIWHDNSGKGAFGSWYLNHIIIRDVQTDRKYYFICNRWFAVEEDDGQVDRVIPVAGKEQMMEFSHLFKQKASKNLSDGHLWFSVVARPPASRFTRCQRVSCCLCLLFSSMLTNGMFYDKLPEDSNAYTFGPFALTPEQIFVGIASNLIIFPINFLLITIFRKSRPRKLRPSRVEEALKAAPERSTSMTDVNPRVKSAMDMERPGSSFLMDAKRSQSSMSRPESSMSTSGVQFETKKKKKKKCELPWWFVIVGWVLLWVAVLTCAIFTTFYGIQFQDTKCKKWITSMLISFFTSVFLTQPIKVFLFAIILSLIVKNPGGDEEEDDDEEQVKPKHDEEFLHNEDDGYGLIAPQRPMYKPKPPNKKSLEAARQQRLKEIQMWSVISEILFYAFFLWILLVISYRSVSVDSFNYKSNMQNVFITTNDTNHAFTKIKNVQDYWVWARSGMLRGLRAGPYYNNYPPFFLRGYIDDKVSRLMGYATLRQVRVKPDSCKIPEQVKSVIDECNEEYDLTSEEERNFGPGWTDISTANVSREEYTYQDGNSLDSYPYWGEMAVYAGGGYLVILNKDYNDMVAQFRQLEAEKWIDEYTRAVFLEFTVYNPSINLFSISTLLAEFRPSGGVFPSYRFEPCMLLPYMSSVLLFQIVCEIIYFAFTVYFVFKELRNIYKQKIEYFKQFWNIIELGICAMSVTAIVIYFYRFFCINTLTEYFEKTSGNGYINFQYVGYWTELFNYIIGFLVFFASLKFLKLLRFNKKISLLTSTLKNSGKDLIHFSIIFNIVFMAFIQLFYLIYHAHLEIFKTMVSSCEAGIVMMMGKFDIYKMMAVNQWLTQLFLFLFVVSVTFIVVNMFLSILNDTFGAVRTDISKQQNDYEIVDFMLSRFKMWTGIGRNSTTISPAELEKERNKYQESLEGKIDYFPDQIDRFLASVSNMYMSKSKFDDFLQKGMYGKMAAKMQQQNESFPGGAHPRHPGTVRLSHGVRGMTDVQTD